MPTSRAYLACSALLVGLGLATASSPALIRPQALRPHQPFVLTVDPDCGLRLDAARADLEKQAWANAFPVLQAILDAPADVLAPGGAAATPVHVSAQAEARRLLEALPEAGVKEYEKRYGAVALKQMKAAAGKEQYDVYRAVALRYPPTDAAAEALVLLAGHAAEQGDMPLAAACYGRLLAQSARADQLAALTLYRATVALRKSGDHQRADAAWKRLEAKVGAGHLLVAGQKRTAADLAKELAAPQPPAADWPIYRGTPQRTGQGVPGSFKLEPAWQLSTLQPPGVGADARNWAHDVVTAGTRQFANKSWPALPAFQPIATKGQVIFRTYNGVTAANVKETSDAPAWWHHTDGGVLSMIRDPNKKGILDSWKQQYTQWGAAAAIFENSLTGVISTDNVRVFVVDDLPLQPHPQTIAQARMGWVGVQNFGALHKQVERTTLSAFSIELGGSLRWQLGGDHDPHRDDADGKIVTQNSFFLGAPLPLGNKLYVLNEKDGALRLLCLQCNDGLEKTPAAPAIVWGQTLANMKDKFALNFGRRMHGAQLAYGDGILVCPTNDGTVCGVDLLSRGLAWAYRYAEPDPLVDVRPARPVFNPQPQNMTYLVNEWKATAPAVHRGRVVWAAPDSQAIHCVNLHDGRPAWREARKADDLYFAGVFADKALVVSRYQCRALHLADGKAAWVSEKTGMPSGQGTAAGGVYYLPLATSGQAEEPAIITIDLAKGSIEHRFAVVKKDGKLEPPGNLIFANGQLLSQTATSLTAYVPVKE